MDILNEFVKQHSWLQQDFVDRYRKVSDDDRAKLRQAASLGTKTEMNNMSVNAYKQAWVLMAQQDKDFFSEYRPARNPSSSSED